MNEPALAQCVSLSVRSSHFLLEGDIFFFVEQAQSVRRKKTGHVGPEKGPVETPMPPPAYLTT